MLRVSVLVGSLVLLAACSDSNTSALAVEGEAIGVEAEARQEYDVRESYELRSGPSADAERLVNQKATEMLGETHYMSVDPSVSVRVLATEGEWVEIQVSQPNHLRDSHRGWTPRSTVNFGQSSDRLNGWIRYTSQVYDAPDDSGVAIGYLLPPSAVGVADDGGDWLRLIHGPVKSRANDDYLSSPDFDSGLYIKNNNFTTELPVRWN